MGVSQAYRVKSVSCDCVGSLEDFLLHEEFPAQESWRGPGIGYIVNVFVCRGEKRYDGMPPTEQGYANSPVSELLSTGCEWCC